MKKERKTHIRSVLIGGASLVALILALLVCLSLISTINRRMNESATSNLHSTTRVIADTLAGMIEMDYDALRVVGAVYLTAGIPDTAQLLAFRDTMELDWIGIVDEQGSGVDCFGNVYSIPAYEGAASWNLRENGYSDAYIGTRSGRPQITLWTPVYEDGVYRGAVLGNVILTQYYSANIFTFYEGEGRTYLFSGQDGRWILKSLGTDGSSAHQTDIYSLLAASGNDAQDIGGFRRAVETGGTGTAVFDFNGEISYLCFLPLSGSPDWYVTTVIARDVLLRESVEVRQMVQGVLSILCVTLLIAMITFALLRIRKAKTDEAHYRKALLENLSSNLGSAFLIYEKATRKTVFVSENVRRLLGLDLAWLSEDAGRLFDWCRIPETDPLRESFLSGTLEKPVALEVQAENELGENTRCIRLELLPADLGQELAVLTDITSDKEVQNSLIEAMQRVESASRAKNDFLSAMSHDLRTPINGVMGMTAIAAAHLDDKARVRDCLSKINKSTTHLLNLINEVLDMSQIESGRIELTNEPFNIAALLQEVLNVNYPGIRQKNHNVKVYIHLMEHEEVIGDPTRLTRVAANLISNAIKYTPSGGTITLSLRERTAMLPGYGCYELTVRDNGIGMSAEFQKRLFQPFEREEDVRLRRIQGTGLGLSIMKNIVDLMMGQVEVESEKGKGACFRVTVNLRLDTREPQHDDRLAGLPVLIVDDDRTVCETVTETLCSIGAAGEWANSGAEALGKIAARHARGADYQVVLLDWQMPGMNVLETARRIRAEAGSQLRIIILTAYEWREIEAEARQAGADAFLAKPIYKAKLVQMLNELTAEPAEPLNSLQLPAAGTIPPGKRVLLAEDNELNREIAVELLRMMGVEADCVNDGAEAVARFAVSGPGTYDMILMDIQMPRMNGYEATRKIRSLDRPDGRTIPIVAMTANAFKKDEQAAREAGMNAHLAKPISIERLVQTLLQFLK